MHQIAVKVISPLNIISTIPVANKETLEISTSNVL